MIRKKKSDEINIIDLPTIIFPIVTILWYHYDFINI